MKLIIAYIQPERLTAVKQALYEREVFKMSVTNALGCGQQKGYHETYRGAEAEVNLLKKVRLEIAVNDNFFTPTVEGIIKGARTGNIGYGKIFIMDLPECIRTGETGGAAMGRGNGRRHRIFRRVSGRNRRTIMNRGLGALLVSLAVACALAAQASDLAVDLLSAYVWRGQVLNDEAVLQPSFTAETPFGLSLNAWLNMDLTDNRGTKGEIDEIDLTATYTLPLGEDAPLSIEIGAATYAFAKDADVVHEATGETLSEDTDTSEIFLNLTGNCPLNPAISVSYDVDKVEGVYASLGISHELEMGEKLAVEGAASVGYADGDYNTYYFATEEDARDDAALNDVTVSLGATFAATEAVSVSAKVAYSVFPDSGIEEGAEANFGEKDLVYGGVNLTYRF